MSFIVLLGLATLKMFGILGHAVVLLLASMALKKAIKKALQS